MEIERKYSRSQVGPTFIFYYILKNKKILLFHIKGIYD